MHPHAYTHTHTAQRCTAIHTYICMHRQTCAHTHVHTDTHTVSNTHNHMTVALTSIVMHIAKFSASGSYYMHIDDAQVRSLVCHAQV